MKNGEKNERSLYKYTALIFLFALLIIIVAFFGQSHFENVMTTDSRVEQESNGIADRAAALSEENLRLSNEKAALEEENASLKTQAETSANDASFLNRKLATYEAVMNAASLYLADDTAGAAAAVSAVDTALLSPSGLAIYNMIITQQ